ncbi:MAG: prepilin-type N-terminal cleavage/methylation domain-containing protein [Planctomycetota bacterium]
MNAATLSLKARGKRGMTLLEVMLALFLFGVLSAFVIQIMDSVLNLWSAGERRGRGDLVYAATVERFRGDLRAMHTGARGWMVLDEWEIPPATEGQPSTFMPRLRFLADGASLPEIDPSAQAAVEVMWCMVPEAPGSKIYRLVRFAKVEDPSAPLQDKRVANAVLRSGNGLVLMDGVLWAEFVAHDGSEKKTKFRVDAGQPFHFPASIELNVEHVSGTARKHPPLLDHAINKEPTTMLLRGNAPSRMPDMVLIDSEWVSVAGQFPSLSITARGRRGSLPAEHKARSEVFFASRYSSQSPVSAGGRRLR